MDVTKHEGVLTFAMLYCCECGNGMSAIRDKHNRYKMKCTKCGCCTIVKTIGRRHKALEIYAPKKRVI